MKKIISLLLIVMMALSLSYAFAEEIDKEIIEFDDTLSFAMLYPEGYTATTTVSNGIMSIFIETENDSDAAYWMLVAPSEEYADLERLNNLNDTEIEAFAQYLASDLAQPEYEVRETGLGSKLLVMRDAGAEMDIVSLGSIYHGYLLVTYIVHPNTETVSAEDIDTGIQIYTDMDFLE